MPPPASPHRCGDAVCHTASPHRLWSCAAPHWYKVSNSRDAPSFVSITAASHVSTRKERGVFLSPVEARPIAVPISFSQRGRKKEAAMGHPVLGHCHGPHCHASLGHGSSCSGQTGPLLLTDTLTDWAMAYLHPSRHDTLHLHPSTVHLHPSTVHLHPSRDTYTPPQHTSTSPQCTSTSPRRTYTPPQRTHHSALNLHRLVAPLPPRAQLRLGVGGGGLEAIGGGGGQGCCC